MVPAKPIARNGFASVHWLNPSDCHAVNSLSDDERLQAMMVPKSSETGSVIKTCRDENVVDPLSLHAFTLADPRFHAMLSTTVPVWILMFSLLISC